MAVLVSAFARHGLTLAYAQSLPCLHESIPFQFREQGAALRRCAVRVSKSWVAWRVGGSASAAGAVANVPLHLQGGRRGNGATGCHRRGPGATFFSLLSIVFISAELNNVRY